MAYIKGLSLWALAAARENYGVDTIEGFVNLTPDQLRKTYGVGAVKVTQLIREQNRLRNHKPNPAHLVVETQRLVKLLNGIRRELPPEYLVVSRGGDLLLCKGCE